MNVYDVWGCVLLSMVACKVIITWGPKGVPKSKARGRYYGILLLWPKRSRKCIEAFKQIRWCKIIEQSETILKCHPKENALVFFVENLFLFWQPIVFFPSINCRKIAKLISVQGRTFLVKVWFPGRGFGLVTHDSLGGFEGSVVCGVAH